MMMEEYAWYWESFSMKSNSKGQKISRGYIYKVSWKRSYLSRILKNYLASLILYFQHLFMYLFILFWGGTFLEYGSSQARGQNWSCSCQATAIATATSMLDTSWVCKLHHSSWQRQILNPLRKVRDWTCILMDTSHWFCYHNGLLVSC